MVSCYFQSLYLLQRGLIICKIRDTESILLLAQVHMAIITAIARLNNGKLLVT